MNTTTSSSPFYGAASYYIDDVSVVPVEPKGLPSGGDTSVCRGDSVRLSTVVDSITDYEWSPSVGLSSDTVSDPLASPDTTTTYTVTKRTSCDTTTAQVTVNVLDTPSVKLPRDSCVQVSDSLELAPSSMSAGAVPSWSPSQGLLDTASASTIAFPDSSTTYTLTVTDTSNGCSTSNSTRIEPERLILSDTSICRGDSVRVSNGGGPAVNYDWSPTQSVSDPSSPTPSLSPDSTTLYSVEQWSACDTTTAQVTVNVLDTPSVKLPWDSCVQVSDSLELEPSSISFGAVATWSPSQGLLDTASASTVAFPDSSSTYSLTVMDTSNGCSASDSVHLAPYLTFPHDTTVQEGDSLRYFMADLPGLHYLWEPTAYVSDPKGHDPFLFPDSTTVFTLTKESTCDTASGDLLIVVEEPPEPVPEKELFIPNVFAPGSKGHEANKRFRVLGGPFEEYHLQVFNRWGELVFESEDPEEGWDGRHHGKAMEAGVYVYRFRGVLSNGTEVEREGDVTLVR